MVKANSCYRRCLPAASALGLLLVLACGQLAGAAGITVAPIRVDLSATHPSSFIQLGNGDLQAKLIHARIFQWDQANGKDRLTPAPDVVISPPIFSLEPGSTQIVRVGLVENLPGSIERSYRILITEVPSTTAPDRVMVTLQLSIPVFVTPSGATQAQVQIRARKLAHHKVELVLSNTGGSHIRLTRLVLRDAASSRVIAEDTAPLYVLAGEQVTRRIGMFAGLTADSISAEAYGEGQVFRATISLRGP